MRTFTITRPTGILLTTVFSLLLCSAAHGDKLGGNSVGPPAPPRVAAPPSVTPRIATPPPKLNVPAKETSKSKRVVKQKTDDKAKAEPKLTAKKKVPSKETVKEAVSVKIKRDVEKAERTTRERRPEAEVTRRARQDSGRPYNEFHEQPSTTAATTGAGGGDKPISFRLAPFAVKADLSSQPQDDAVPYTPLPFRATTPPEVRRGEPEPIPVNFQISVRMPPQVREQDVDLRTALLAIGIPQHLYLPWPSTVVHYGSPDDPPPGIERGVSGGSNGSYSSTGSHTDERGNVERSVSGGSGSGAETGGNVERGASGGSDGKSSTSEASASSGSKDGSGQSWQISGKGQGSYSGNSTQDPGSWGVVYTDEFAVGGWSVGYDYGSGQGLAPGSGKPDITAPPAGAELSDAVPPSPVPQEAPAGTQPDGSRPDIQLRVLTTKPDYTSVAANVTAPPRAPVGGVSPNTTNIGALDAAEANAARQDGPQSDTRSVYVPQPSGDPREQPAEAGDSAPAHTIVWWDNYSEQTVFWDDGKTQSIYTGKFPPPPLYSAPPPSGDATTPPPGQGLATAPDSQAPGSPRLAVVVFNPNPPGSVVRAPGAGIPAGVATGPAAQTGAVPGGTGLSGLGTKLDQLEEKLETEKQLGLLAQLKELQNLLGDVAKLPQPEKVGPESVLGGVKEAETESATKQPPWLENQQGSRRALGSNDDRPIGQPTKTPGTYIAGPSERVPDRRGQASSDEDSGDEGSEPVLVSETPPRTLKDANGTTTITHRVYSDGVRETHVSHQENNGEYGTRTLKIHLDGSASFVQREFNADGSMRIEIHVVRGSGGGTWGPAGTPSETDPPKMSGIWCPFGCGPSKADLMIKALREYQASFKNEIPRLTIEAVINRPPRSGSTATPDGLGNNGIASTSPIDGSDGNPQPPVDPMTGGGRGGGTYTSGGGGSPSDSRTSGAGGSSGGGTCVVDNCSGGPGGPNDPSRPR